MTAALTNEGYAQTKTKMTNLTRRLSVIERRTDLPPRHKANVLSSYHAQLRQYEREIKLYEAVHAAK